MAEKHFPALTLEPQRIHQYLLTKGQLREEAAACSNKHDQFIISLKSCGLLVSENGVE